MKEPVESVVSAMPMKQKGIYCGSKLTYSVNNMRDTIIGDSICRSDLYAVDEVLPIFDGDGKLCACERSVSRTVLKQWKVSCETGDDMIQ